MPNCDIIWLVSLEGLDASRVAPTLYNVRCACLRSVTTAANFTNNATLIILRM